MSRPSMTMPVIAPVKVDEPLIDLLEQCVEWEEQSQGAVNVCMGSVLGDLA